MQQSYEQISGIILKTKKKQDSDAVLSHYEKSLNHSSIAIKIPETSPYPEKLVLAMRGRKDLVSSIWYNKSERELTIIFGGAKTPDQVLERFNLLRENFKLNPLNDDEKAKLKATHQPNKPLLKVDNRSSKFSSINHIPKKNENKRICNQKINKNWFASVLIEDKETLQNSSNKSKDRSKLKADKSEKALLEEDEINSFTENFDDAPKERKKRYKYSFAFTKPEDKETFNSAIAQKLDITPSLQITQNTLNSTQLVTNVIEISTEVTQKKTEEAITHSNDLSVDFPDDIENFFGSSTLKSKDITFDLDETELDRYFPKMS